MIKKRFKALTKKPSSLNLSSPSHAVSSPPVLPPILIETTSPASPSFPSHISATSSPYGGSDLYFGHQKGDGDALNSKPSLLGTKAKSVSSFPSLTISSASSSTSLNLGPTSSSIESESEQNAGRLSSSASSVISASSPNSVAGPFEFDSPAYHPSPSTSQQPPSTPPWFLSLTSSNATSPTSPLFLYESVFERGREGTER